MDTSSTLLHLALSVAALRPTGNPLERAKTRGYRRLLNRLALDIKRDLNRPQRVSKAVRKLEREAMGY